MRYDFAIALAMLASTATANAGPHLLPLAVATMLGAASTSRGALGQSSSQRDEESPVLQTLAVAYYAGKHRVGIDQAQQRIAIQDRAAGIDDDLAALLGDQYAGIWYDADDAGRLKIGVTRQAAAQVESVHRIVDRYSLGADADLVPVSYSQVELKSRQDSIRDTIWDMIASSHATIGYNTNTNTVMVTALAVLSAREEARVQSLSRLAGVSVLRVDVTSLSMPLTSCNVTYCDPPLRGGREMFIGKGACTTAFMGQNRVYPFDFWAMTAGHCIFFLGTSWSARNEAYESHLIDVSAYYGFGGGPGFDAGMVSIDGDGYWESPAPIAAVVVKPSDDTTYDPNYEIRHTSYSSIGQTLCFTGRTSGTHCGEVITLGVDGIVNGPDGVSYEEKNFGELDIGALPGDSGSPLYKINRAYGIAAAGICVGSSYCRTRYQGIRAAENLLNVNVLLAPSR